MRSHDSLTGLIADGEQVTDEPAAWPLASTEVLFDSTYMGLTLDVIEAPDGSTHRRSVVRHGGAVGVVALDADDRVLLVQQYRHPVGQRLLELPAGVLDVPGESRAEAAARELAEEADVVAAEWSSLGEAIPTPGYSSEQWEIFLATDLSPVPADQRTAREAEEADMVQLWLPFGEAIEAVFDGRITDAMTVIGLLQVHARRTRTA